MVKFISARKGYIFALTELGVEQPRIRAKFNKDHSLYKQYQRCVPVSWVEKGWVKEIKGRK